MLGSVMSGIPDRSERHDVAGASDAAVPAVTPAPQALDAAPHSARRGSAPVVLWWVLGVCVAAVAAAGLQIGLGVRDQGFFLLALTFLVCAVAAWVDVATRRIPNLLTYPALVLGLVLNVLLAPVLRVAGADVAVVWLGATETATSALLGFGLCAFLGVVSFIVRGLGGGDVKLIAALGALLGLGTVVGVLFNALLFAGVIGLVNWALQGTLVPRLQVVATNLLATLVTRDGAKDIYPFGRSEAPFGLAVLLGLLLAEVFGIRLHTLLVLAVATE